MCLLVGFGSSARSALIAYDSFESYATGQLESGPDRDPGVTADGGTGWSSSFDVNDDDKSRVTIEDRSGRSLHYENGAISINGGDRSLRLSGSRLSSDTLLTRWFPQQPRLAPVYFSFLYVAAIDLEASGSDSFFLGLDSFPRGPQARTTIGSERFGFGEPEPYSFVASISRDGNNGVRQTNSDAGIQLGATYFLVGEISSFSGTNYDRVDLFINPETLTKPASSTLDLAISPGSGIDTLSVLMLNAQFTETADAFHFDELRIGSDYTSVVPEVGSVLWLLGAGVVIGMHRTRT